MLYRVFEWSVYLQGFIAVCLLWLWIAGSPAFLIWLIGGLIFLIFEEIHINWLYGCFALGCLVGLYAAEYIRRKYGCINFMGKLLSTPEIEGWRTPEQHVRDSWPK